MPIRTASSVRVSGSLASHYAPRVGVVLVEPSEAVARAESLRMQGLQVGVLGRPSLALPRACCALTFPRIAGALPGCSTCACARRTWRGWNLLLACLPPAHGLGVAVRDRLARAAAPRPSEA